MNVTVIGQVTHDTLIYPEHNWRITTGFGGSLYTVAALSSLIDGEINLVCNIGADIYDQVIDLLSEYPNVNIDGVKRVDSPNLHCYILFVSEYGTQYDAGRDIPITYTQVADKITWSDFILVSPMTGFDLGLRTLKLIRRHSSVPLLLDYHILALDRDKLGNRFLRKRRNWLDWCTSCDYLQLNKFEAESLIGNSINSEKDVADFFRSIINKGVRGIAVTLGSEGALICYKNAYKDPLITHLNPHQVAKVEDTTGCGDTFAASFIIGLLKTNDILVSYQYANKIAGIKSGLIGFAELPRLLSYEPFGVDKV